MEMFSVGMSAFWYELWYRKKVSPNLDRETKTKIAQRISDISQRVPIFERGVRVEKGEVPELAPLTKLDRFTGIQLYVVLTEISKELGIEVPSVSRLAFRNR